MFGNGEFAFGNWDTPFQNSDITILGVNFDPLAYHKKENELTIRLQINPDHWVYKIEFKSIFAFRVLDEHGLMQIWEKTSEFDGRPALTTFMICNHLWTQESLISFLPTYGWSYLLASDNLCIEIVSEKEPIISNDD